MNMVLEHKLFDEKVERDLQKSLKIFNYYFIKCKREKRKGKSEKK